MSGPTLTGLTDLQADGIACVWCSATHDDQVPVGYTEAGGQVFACAESCECVVRAFLRVFQPGGYVATLGELREAWERFAVVRDRARPVVAPPVGRVRIGRRVLLVIIAGLVVATVFAVIATAAGREPIPTDPGVPSTVTTIGPR